MKSLIEKVKTDLLSEDPKIKYGCTKKLITIAKNNPAELYPYFDYFVKLLDNENQIIKWTAIDIIGYLSKVDKEKKVDRLIDILFGFLNEGKLITANHAIAALANITLTKPEYQREITDELLRVEHYTYDTEECRNIALGKVILAISSYFDQLKDKKAVIEFVKRQTQNKRNATKKKAEKFLRKKLKKKEKEENR
jgi:hypothetical protein